MLYKLTLLLSITLYNILDFVIASPESTQLA
ncbi:raqprd family integrative conjugative element protein, partial [Salmonella enterica subsp. enterica serovar Typhimurium]|nr:raqprd family integrative conjugative element protein [Salmonella enterica subsp. enterica serovar Typhimurium]